MPLSAEARKYLIVATSSDAVGKEIADAMDAVAAAAGQAKCAAVALLGATTNLAGVDGTGSNAAPLAGTEARLDAAEAKIDALITSLKNSGQIA